MVMKFLAYYIVINVITRNFLNWPFGTAFSVEHDSSSKVLNILYMQQIDVWSCLQYKYKSFMQEI
jgi:hypothetical protein